MKLICVITLKADNVTKCPTMDQAYCHTVDIKYFLVMTAAMVNG